MKSKPYRGGRLPASKSASIQRELEQRFPGIDDGFRPSSYWQPSNPAQALANIKGAARKRAALRSAATLDPSLLVDALPNDERVLASRIHPSLMGGEYLPDYRRDEVEIARIDMASVTRDVIAIRARPDRRAILYRVVDEYDNDYDLRFWRSTRPLTLAELVHFMDHASREGIGLGVGFLDFMVRDQGCELEDYVDFQTFSSEFYPQFGDHYQGAIDAWVQEVMPS